MKAYRVSFLLPARQDLFEVYAYIEDAAGPQTALAYVERMKAACFALASFPERGTLRTTVDPPVRTIGFERRATIVFRVTDTEVEIMRILHGGQDIDQILSGPAND